ncbi:MAG: (d)CMP kinase [Victivallales bacterium]|nr:(d)CMP kinase [Victivallales bacterium]
MKFQVAIDGPAASGKSTLARLLAGRIGGYYINTGDMYRAATWYILSRGIDPAHSPEDAAALLAECDIRYRIADGKPQLFLNDAPVDAAAIRSPEVASKVSHTARIPAVRQWMLERQQGCSELGIVIMEGRDIGTVIFPRARFKYFVTASPEERARRRFAQPGEVPPGATLESVARDIAERDRIDSTREVAPLKPAEDAVMICSDGFTAEELADNVAQMIRKELAAG